VTEGTAMAPWNGPNKNDTPVDVILRERHQTVVMRIGSELMNACFLTVARPGVLQEMLLN